MRWSYLSLLPLAFCAACTDSPAPTPSKVSTAASQSSTAPRTGPLTTGPNVLPGEKPPELPEAATEKGLIGAIDFATFYVAAWDWSLATNDSYLLRAISDRTCSGCMRAVHRIDELSRRGEILLGARISLVSWQLENRKRAIRADEVVSVEVSQERTRPVGPRSSSSPPSKATTTTYLIYVSWNGTSWRAVQVTAP